MSLIVPKTTPPDGTSSEGDHRGLFENAPCAMVIVDQSGCMTAVNRFAERLLSSSLAALLRRSFPSLVVAKDRDQFRAALRAHGSPRDVQVQVSVRSRTIEVVISMGQFSSDKNRALDTLLVIRDATLLEAMTDERRQASKMEALGRLAGGIAHDFNTALTGIAGCADVALRRIDENQPARAYIQEIKDAAMRASAMPRKLVDFSRRRVTARSVFDVGVLLDKVEPALHRMVGDQITLHITKSGDPVRVRDDESQVAQIINNLVTNARDAIDGEGRVDIEIESATISRASPKRLRYLPPGRYVCLTVRDTGRGMDEATLARAFEPFFSTKDERQGAGLGLSMVATTVETAGGHIETISKLLGGTTLSIYLPYVEAPAAPLEPVEDLEGEETILVIEDDRLVRKTVRDNLEHRGYRVLEADSGTEALRQCHSYPGTIDLVLANMILPGMNGLEAFRGIRLQRPNVRAVFMSAAYLTEELATEAQLELGRNFIEKPFEEKQLAELLRRFLDLL